MFFLPLFIHVVVLSHKASQASETKVSKKTKLSVLAMVWLSQVVSKLQHDVHKGAVEKESPKEKSSKTLKKCF